VSRLNRCLAFSFFCFLSFSFFLFPFAFPLAFAAPAAQQQAPRPTFRSGVELVAIDVQVVDRDGKPIPRLTPTDFDVKINGRRRGVVSADLVSYDAGIVGKVAPPAVTRVAPSAAPPGRVFIVAVDEASLRPSNAMVAREAARRFIKKLQPGDFVGVYKFPIYEKMLELTRIHEDASRVFDRIVGTYDPPRSEFNLLPSEVVEITGGDRQTLDEAELRECGTVTRSSTAPMTGCRSRIAGEASFLSGYAESDAAQRVMGLRLLLDRLQEMPDRKTLVILSGGMLAAEAIGRPDVSTMMTRLGREAALANTNLYVLHIDGSFEDALFARGRPQAATAQGAPPGVAVTVQPPMARMSRDGNAFAAGLERLADAAGGGYIRIRAGTPDYAFDRVLRETSAYYLLAIAPEDRDRIGRLHFLDVAVRTKGAVVRAKSHVFIPKK
jgi:VWFA-related protein